MTPRRVRCSWSPAVGLFGPRVPYCSGLFRSLANGATAEVADPSSDRSSLTPAGIFNGDLHRKLREARQDVTV